jgi:arsenite methyltransferase
MRSTVLGLLDPVFHRPRGLGGRLGAAIMAGVNADTERYVVDQAKLHSADTVVVVGPGPGIGLRAAAEATPNGLAIGVEPAELMRQTAQRRCADLPPDRFRLVPGTAAATGLPTESADAVLSVDSAQLWPDLPAALTELRRVLRPGGRLLVTVHTWIALGLGVADLRRAALTAGLVDVQCYQLAHDAPTGSAIQLRAAR